MQFFTFKLNSTHRLLSIVLYSTYKMNENKNKKNTENLQFKKSNQKQL